MPTTEQHLRQSVHNSAFFDVVEPIGKYSDWAATTLFYVAVQLVDAYLASRTPAVHPNSHAERDHEIAADPNLRPIYSDYRQLKDRSRSARYRPPVSFTPQFLKAQLRDRHLGSIRAQIRKYVANV